MNAKETYNAIKKGLIEITDTLRSEKNKVWIRPESTGKATQWGSYQEIVKLSSEVDGILPCIDFAHVHAREGKYNTYDEFRKVLSHIEKNLGKTALKNMHIHVAGIEYGPKGERHHLNLKDSDMNYKDLLKVWKEFKIKGNVVSESPNIEQDALLLKKYYHHKIH